MAVYLVMSASAPDYGRIIAAGPRTPVGDRGIYLMESEQAPPDGATWCEHTETARADIRCRAKAGETVAIKFGRLLDEWADTNYRTDAEAALYHALVRHLSQRQTIYDPGYGDPYTDDVRLPIDRKFRDGALVEDDADGVRILTGLPELVARGVAEHIIQMLRDGATDAEIGAYSRAMWDEHALPPNDQRSAGRKRYLAEHP